MKYVVASCIAATALVEAITRAGSVAAAPVPATRHLEYVVTGSRITVYDIDQGNRLVQTLVLPALGPASGVVASPVTAMLYISYGGSGGYQGNGSMLAYDLLRRRAVWQHHYDSGVDSMAITPDGSTIYMPAGEFSGSGTWSIIDAKTGALTGRLQGPIGAHNTIIGPDGKFVYLGGVDDPYLEVASTATGKVVAHVGPLHGPGVRPFTINKSQTLAFTTARSYLGFQVSNINSGRVLYNVAPPGFSFDPNTFTRTPDHGIALSPDGRQLYLIDTPNGFVHVFDVSGLPKRRPRDIANIKLAHPPPNDGWLQYSRDGRYVYVGRAGDVISTKTRKIVAYLPPLQQTADFLEIDWRNGHPIATTSRYGVTNVRKR